MIDYVYKKMDIPESCYLGKKVFKKLFYENTKFNTTDKKAFKDDIDSVLWQYTLKPTTIQIPSYKDEEREYLEVAILQINLKKSKRYNRISEIIHRAIPHPLLLIFTDTKKLALSIASKRFSQSEKGAIIVDEFFITNLMDTASLTKAQEAFLESLNIRNLPHTNFYALYSALEKRFIALDCSEFSGKFELKKDSDRRKGILSDCKKLQLKISEIRSKIKKETQFSRKVELNSKIKELEQKLSEKIKKL